MSKKNKINYCTNCDGGGKLITEAICPVCEGTGVKLSDETTELSSLVGGELFEDDPKFLDFDEEDYQI